MEKDQKMDTICYEDLPKKKIWHYKSILGFLFIALLIILDKFINIDKIFWIIGLLLFLTILLFGHNEFYSEERIIPENYRLDIEIIENGD
jgi:hypothetical protein